MRERERGSEIKIERKERGNRREKERERGSEIKIERKERGNR